MTTLPPCPLCSRENTYLDAGQLVCADCGHEWQLQTPGAGEPETRVLVKDANGNVLVDGDAVVLIKDLKVKGSSTTLKMGTKVKSIRLVGGDHGVDCKVDGGSYLLKAEFLRKV
jgi:protein PhnA